MKAALVVLAAVAVLAVCDARRRTTTMRPCPGRCSLEWIPVCAQDPSGDYYLFTNQCLLWLCACRTNTKFTELDDKDDCPYDARTKCLDQQDQGHGAGRSDASDSSDAASSEGQRAEGRWVPPLRLPADAECYRYESSKSVAVTYKNIDTTLLVAVSS